MTEMTKMHRKRRRLKLALVTALAVLVAPGLVMAQDAVFYELTENMTLDNLAAPTVRTATAALQGTARAGTPLCPTFILGVFGGESCTVTIVGNDVIDLGTGTGTLDGTFAIVVNLDNPVDAAEFVVLTGTFAGSMQALPDPRILIWASLTLDTVLGLPAAALGMGNPSAFTGVFRLPFSVNAQGNPERVKKGKAAFYLGDDGKKIKVGKDEHSLGIPTVRLEIVFDP